MEYEWLSALDDAEVVELHALYRQAWWSRDRCLEDVRRMLAGTDLVFGVRETGGGPLRGFARVLTDGVYKAVVYDVIVDERHQGLGLGRELMDRILRHPDVKDVRQVELFALPDLHGFYENHGFSTETAGLVLLRREI